MASLSVFRYVSTQCLFISSSNPTVRRQTKHVEKNGYNTSAPLSSTGGTVQRPTLHSTKQRGAAISAPLRLTKRLKRMLVSLLASGK